MGLIYNRTYKIFPLILYLLFAAAACQAAGGTRAIHLDRIQLPPGFTIKLYARNVPNARSMDMSPGGVLFVGTRSAGKVYAILDHDQDQAADEVITMVNLVNNRAVEYRVFAEGWLEGNRAWGRSVDILVMPDGAMLVSDDRAGVIYRIAYGE